MGTDWTQSDASDAMRSAAADRGEPLHQEDYNRWRGADGNSGPHSATISRRWGWSETAEKAGVVVGTSLGSQQFSDGEVLDAIREADRWGGTESEAWLRAEDYQNWRESESPEAPSYRLIQERFGGWSPACKQADVVPARYHHDVWGPPEDPERITCNGCDAASGPLFRLEGKIYCADCAAEHSPDFEWPPVDDWQALAGALHEEGGVPERRAEVVALVAAGHSYREVADTLDLSEPTQVGQHISRYRTQDFAHAKWLSEHGPDI